jgi:hypothetical protein
MGWRIEPPCAQFLLPLVVSLSGCGLVMGGSRQVVRATSSPAGAMVTTTPQTSEVSTPAALSLERKNSYVSISIEGK